MNRPAIFAFVLCAGVLAAFVAKMPASAPSARAAEATTTAAAAPAAAPARPTPEPTSVDQHAPYFEACAREGLNESECVGRLIWFKATAGNERFHTYTFQQRIGVMIDWYRVLRTDHRDDRFRAWGIINDPACCKPGDPD